MTPRKEIFIKVKEALNSIPQIELVDFFRGQFSNGKEHYPNCYTAALIRINNIAYDTMTQSNQEGETSIDVILYCKDGWMDQHNQTADPDHGFMEIDLQDAIVEALQFLKGEQFKPLQQTEDDTEDINHEGIMSFKSSFTTRVYRKIKPKYTKRSISLTS
ncbi:hypothetical protein [Pseudotamlana carrageenivorans]|uniref:Uncharacterized protein n=1 Tax=Pseudotamlana carrageenivorans TaxID=2069432 RepID=A0A2I7SKQ4_9FLAO|nr:hypothetical protein [Tamlana carrageenivorans]AUS06471.1 hypothetical protein C1A40_13905 [Tamlana carrageenivorans]